MLFTLPCMDTQNSLRTYSSDNELHEETCVMVT